MKKHKQKVARALKPPKAPGLVMSAQLNPRERKTPKARRLGMSALGTTNAPNASSALSTPNTLNTIKTPSTPSILDALNTTLTPSDPKDLDDIKSIILSSPNLSTAYQTLRRHRVKNTTFNVNSIQSYPELIAALEAKAVQITLGANIIAPDNILISHDVAINFNGYNIISEETNPGARVLDIRSGEVTLTGKGKIFAMGARSVAIRVFGAISIGMPTYTTLTIDDSISLFAPDSYGILISPNLGVAYGLVINLSGEIIARDGIGLSSRIRGRDTNLPTINIRSGARITADETYGSAIEAAGYAAWNIGAAKLTGATGALLKSGLINFAHTEIIATGAAYTEPQSSAYTELQAPISEDSDTFDDPNTASIAEGLFDDPAPANAAIRIASAAKHDLNITVEGGSYLGEKSFAVAGDPSSLESFVIKGGDFSGAIDVLHYAIEPELDIEEGSFSLHPALHLKILRPEITLLPEPEPDLELAPECTSRPEPMPELASKSEPNLEPVPETNPELELATKPETKPAPQPAQKLPLPPTYNEIKHIENNASEHIENNAIEHIENNVAEHAEKIAMTQALADALAEMKSLQPSDYEAGFSHLETAIRDAEQLLAAKTITLAAIRDASAHLLAAFDSLKERDEFSLTDDELDELFYHGAVLDELATSPETTPEVTLQQATPPQTIQPTTTQPTPQPTATTSPKTTPISNQQPPTPANPTGPATNNPPTHFFIDEMTPTRNWSTGVALIDEFDPHLCISRPLPESLRPKFRPNLSPIINFSKSLSAALRAGFDAYRKTRSAAKN